VNEGLICGVCCAEALQLSCPSSGHDQVAEEESCGLNKERIPSNPLIIFIRAYVGEESKK